MKTLLFTAIALIMGSSAAQAGENPAHVICLGKNRLEETVTLRIGLKKPWLWSGWQIVSIAEISTGEPTAAEISAEGERPDRVSGLEASGFGWKQRPAWREQMKIRLKLDQRFGGTADFTLFDPTIGFDPVHQIGMDCSREN